MNEYSDEDKVSLLSELAQHAGWKVIQEELDRDIELTEAKLHGEKKLEEHETIDQLQRERLDRLELRNLPENLIREYTQESEQPDYEVYE